MEIVFYIGYSITVMILIWGISWVIKDYNNRNDKFKGFL
ncbi:MAG: hypothetical protein JWQ79_2693 [Mucilaginibacter sp.]|jgi:hypothetical protein|nr:hypothetical protein [Mucilaginibacter sp.]